MCKTFTLNVTNHVAFSDMNGNFVFLLHYASL
jgi:hypothetical protein